MAKVSTEMIVKCANWLYIQHTIISFLTHNLQKKHKDVWINLPAHIQKNTSQLQICGDYRKNRGKSPLP